MFSDSLVSECGGYSKPFFQIVRDAEVAGAQFSTDLFDLQLNCNQKWIRKRIEAESPIIRSELAYSDDILDK